MTTENAPALIPDDIRSEEIRFLFGQLYNIMRELRTHCPWDKEQTHESLRQYLLEETYEVLETLDRKQWDELKKELGDLLLQILFHAIIEQEQNRFHLADVIRSLNEKLIRRHPHVFGQTVVNGSAEVLENWEQIKLKETDRDSVLDGVPNYLPALVRAYRVQEKASRVGFDWGHIDDVWIKVQEEMNELKNAHQHGDLKKTEEELGDLLFAIVNVSRFLPVNPEDALRGTIDKFIRRFRYVEEQFAKQQRNMKDASLEEMDVFWNEAKVLEKKNHQEL